MEEQELRDNITGKFNEQPLLYILYLTNASFLNSPKGHALEASCITKGHVSLCKKHQKTYYPGQKCPRCIAIDDAKELAAAKERKEEKDKQAKLDEKKEWDASFGKPGKNPKKN